MPLLPSVAPVLTPGSFYGLNAEELAIFVGTGVVLIDVLVFLVMKLREMPHESRAKLHPTMDPGQVVELMHGTPPLIVDLRTVEEFRDRTGHLRGALNIPYAELAERIDEIRGSTGNRPVVLVDKDDRLSHLAFPLLHREGFAWLYVLKGGMKWWVARKMPVYH